MLGSQIIAGLPVALGGLHPAPAHRLHRLRLVAARVVVDEDERSSLHFLAVEQVAGITQTGDDVTVRIEDMV